MKVLHILYQSLPQVSGSSIRSRDVLMSQKEVGINVIAITSPFQNSISGTKKDRINDIDYIRTSSGTKNSISDERKGIFTRIFRFFSIITFTIAIYKTAKKENPDILHAHAMFFCGIPAIVVGKLQKKPVVYEFRSLWMFQKRNQKENKLLNRIIEKLLLKIELYTIKKSGSVIVLNENLKGYLSKKTNNLNATVIGNAVNTSLIDSLKTKELAKREPVVFGYIGTLTEYEGLEFLVECFQELFDEGFSNKLLLFGTGVNLKNIVKQIDKRKDVDTIKYKGEVVPAEVHTAFKQVDVIINPRLNTPLTNSVTPLKPLEAMAYDKVFIGSDVGGITEIVKPEVGIIFKSEDKKDLKLAIKKAINLTSSERNHYLTNGQNYVQKEKSWLKNAVIYQNIYQNLTKDF